MRKARGWSQERLAAAAGLSTMQIVHIERGATDPKLSTIMKLANALNVGADELLRPQ